MSDENYYKLAKFYVEQSKNVSELCIEVLVRAYKLDNQFYQTDKENKISRDKLTSILDKEES